LYVLNRKVTCSVYNKLHEFDVMCLAGEITADAGEDISLYCNVITSSHVTVDWWLFRPGKIDLRMCYNGQIIHLPEKYSLERTKYGYRLIVRNVNEDDSGKYVCRWSRSGENTFFVNVRSRPTSTFAGRHTYFACSYLFCWFCVHHIFAECNMCMRKYSCCTT